MLGINSTPEELQHVLQTLLLADMGNAVNVVDHVIVFKKSDEERASVRIIKRLVENKIILNIQKCEFVKEGIE